MDGIDRGVADGRTDGTGRWTGLDTGEKGSKRKNNRERQYILPPLGPLRPNDQHSEKKKSHPHPLLREWKGRVPTLAIRNEENRGLILPPRASQPVKAQPYQVEIYPTIQTRQQPASCASCFLGTYSIWLYY